jgi:hypothetical protein
MVGRLKAGLLVLPGVGISLLPKLLCPACWSALAAVFSSIGLGFLMFTTYLLPVTLLFLVVAVGALASRTSRSRSRGPLGVGVAAAVLILVGSFYLESVWVSYLGVGLLMVASVWSMWPHQAIVGFRPTCLPAGTDVPRQESRRG